MNLVLGVLLLAISVVAIRWQVRAMNRIVIEMGGQPLRWPRLRWCVLAVILVVSASQPALAVYYCCEEPVFCAYWENEWVRWWMGCIDPQSGAR